MDIQKLQQDWFTEEKEKIEGKNKSKTSKRKRQYLHFDKRISNLTTEGIQDIWNSSKVSRHSFYPFIRFIKRIKKYKKDPVTKEKSFKIKERPIDFASHYDSSIYSWYSYILSDLYEEELIKRNVAEVPIAYRKIENKSNVHFAKDIIDFIKLHPDYAVLTFDVEKFYENIDHLQLKVQWIKLLSLTTLPKDHYQVFKSLTNFYYVDTKQLHKKFKFTQKDHPKMQTVCDSKDFRTKVCEGGLLLKNNNSREESGIHYNVGIPQGSSISCLLSNLYMIDFDTEISSKVNSINGLYRRYSDDIILVVPKDDTELVDKIVDKEIRKINLTINKNKSEKRHFVTKEGQLVCIDSDNKKISSLQYLGINFDGENAYLRHAGIAKFQRRRNRTVRHTITTLKKGRHAPAKMFLQKFTHEGKENYLTYASRAKTILHSNKLKKQVSKNRISKQLKKSIEKYT